MKMRKQFFGLTPYGKTDLWYCEGSKLWKPIDEADRPFTNLFLVRSYKAARRHLRKHKEIPVGTRFLLSSRWCGYDRVLTKRRVDDG